MGKLLNFLLKCSHSLVATLQSQCYITKLGLLYFRGKHVHTEMPFSGGNVLERLRACFKAGNRWLTPGRILSIAFLFGLTWGIVFLVFNEEIYRDVANCYAWYAREFGQGNWNGPALAGLPPLNIFLGGLLTRCGIETYRALMLLSLLFYLLTIFPLYRLLKNFVSPQAAAWGTVLFVSAPKIIRFAGMGLLESGRDFFLVLSFALLFRILRGKYRPFHLIFLGISLGFLSLTRGEGILMAGTVGLCMILLWRNFQWEWRSFFRQVALPMLAVAGVALVVISPRLVNNYRVCGYPVIDTRAIGTVNLIPGAKRIFHERRTPEPTPRTVSGKAPPKPSSAPAVSDWKNLMDLPKNFTRGGYELYRLLGLIGVGMLLYRRRWRWEYSLLIGYVAFNSLAFCHFAVAYRYFIFVIPLFMVFTLFGIGFLLEFARRFRMHGVAVAILALLVAGQSFNAPLTFRETTQRQLGRYLKTHKADFLPPGGNRALVVHSIGQPEVVYWCDETRLTDYSAKCPDPNRVAGFDVLVVGARDSADVNILRNRSDLREALSPVPEFRLFVPVEKKETRK